MKQQWHLVTNRNSRCGMKKVPILGGFRKLPLSLVICSLYYTGQV